MEVSALKYSGGIGLHARSPLLRLQSDERLIALIRRGNTAAFEVLVSRYSTRLLSFCRHLLGSREDSEDVLQEIMAAAFNAILADDRPINVRPWLYRIARNRSLNHLRRTQPIGVDSMDVHFFDHGQTTADKVHEREEFRLLVGDIQDLPETQRTALVLREMDALPYEQIAEVMETTVPSVKSLLVRARVSLAEAAEARALSCDDVRIELGEIAEGLRRRPTPLVRRHLRNCDRCTTFRTQLRDTNKALAALLPIGPFMLFKQALFGHVTHSAVGGSSAGGSTAAAGTGAAASSSAAAGTGAAAGSGAAGTIAAGSGAVGTGAVGAAGSTAAGGILAGGTASGFVTAGVGALATKAAAGLAAAALVTAGAVEVSKVSPHHMPAAGATTVASAGGKSAAPAPPSQPAADAKFLAAKRNKRHKQTVTKTSTSSSATKTTAAQPTATTSSTTTTTTPPVTTTTTSTTTTTTSPPGRTQSQTDPTVLPPPPPPVTSSTTTTSTTTSSSSSSTETSSTQTTTGVPQTTASSSGSAY